MGFDSASHNGSTNSAALHLINIYVPFRLLPMLRRLDWDTIF